MTEHRERRVNQTIDLLSAWAGVGAWVKAIFMVVIVAMFVWSLKTILDVILWLRVLLG